MLRHYLVCTHVISRNYSPFHQLLCKVNTAIQTPIHNKSQQEKHWLVHQRKFTTNLWYAENGLCIYLKHHSPFHQLLVVEMFYCQKSFRQTLWQKTFNVVQLQFVSGQNIYWSHSSNIRNINFLWQLWWLIFLSFSLLYFIFQRFGILRARKYDIGVLWWCKICPLLLCILSLLQFRVLFYLVLSFASGQSVFYQFSSVISVFQNIIQKRTKSEIR